MKPGPRPPAPRQVPTLTEVLQPPGVAAAPAVAAALPATSAPDDGEHAELVRRTLLALHQRLDATLEPRLRAAIAPAVAAITDALLAEARARIGDMLRDAVREAVAEELVRRGRADKPPR
jgi:hypothetical protein